jgi:uncharacterized protein (TIGR02996 family)
MSEDDAFISAIVSDAQNHAIRLIYADWLEERNDLRAQFLRAKVADAKPARLKAISRGLDRSWVGLMNVGVCREDTVEIIGGALEGIQGTVKEVDLKRGVVLVWPHMLCRPFLPEVHLADIALVRGG